MNNDGLHRCHAVIPAAGFSRRMGTPKLLLDVAGRPVIVRLIEALQSGGVDTIHVLAREEDRSLRTVLANSPAECHQTVEPTPDMRASVEQLLERVRLRCSPTEDDAWLLCPADHPALSALVVSRLIAEHRRHPKAILVPVHAGRRGHPTLFPWTLAARVPSIPAGQGVNWLLNDHGTRVVEVLLDDPSILIDLDIPDDYERLLLKLRGLSTE